MTDKIVDVKWPTSASFVDVERLTLSDTRPTSAADIFCSSLPALTPTSYLPTSA